ncbi:3-oxoacyl-ACP reductase [Pacificimonas flava]|uniref:3-oxoacyl-ACP reductase n=2 Tax=Pacificimonas TaxID=1960290 RepID=A0A219B207_9SPHN|nr:MULTISPECIES: SDR family oxidoreductase [Pacificimonas]MBZ6379700.1 SDR family oxidoreductase [Pacificimonas aurantium]OWV31839.1 3-oxoacyl-ACP reductase [Pacificimonas flava]
MDVNSLFSLEGKTALVTGGSRGIGRMIVEGFLGAGAKRVYITARKIEQVTAAAEEMGDRVVAIPMDISTLEGCERLAKEIAEREDKLDILVNNAGAAWGADYLEFPEQGWDKVMDLNVKSLFFLTKALHGPLTAAASSQEPAKVVNIASIDGMRLNSMETYSYQASKAAVIQLTKRMAARLVSDNVYVNAIAPGAFASDMNRAARDHGDALSGGIPAGRIGEAEDMAAAAIYLASRAGDYVIGHTVVVDGGLVHAALPTAGPS